MTTLLEAQAKLAEYKAAEALILEAQEVRLGGPGIDRWQKQAELKDVQKGISQWQRTVNTLTARASGRATFGGLTFSSPRFD